MHHILNAVFVFIFKSNNCKKILILGTVHAKKKKKKPLHVNKPAVKWQFTAHVCAKG